jgi:DNA repair exonuclease SbcCD ATPase subunit
MQTETTREAGARATDELAQARRAIHGVRPWQRERLAEARARLAWAEQKRAGWERREQELRRKMEAIERGPRSPARWDEEHGPVRAQLGAIEQEIERREERLRACAIEQAIERPPDYITRVLGERPVERERRAVWEQAAGRIERYRQEHGLSATETALGGEPHGSARARRGWRQVLEATLEARKRLGLARETAPIAELRHERRLGRDGPGLGL